MTLQNPGVIVSYAKNLSCSLTVVIIHQTLHKYRYSLHSLQYEGFINMHV